MFTEHEPVKVFRETLQERLEFDWTNSMAPQKQLIKLIRSGIKHLACSQRAKVYCATNRGNMHLVPVKVIDFQHIPHNLLLTSYSLHANMCKNKPFAEAGIGAPSRPLDNTLRLGFSRNSYAGFKDEQELYRI